MGQRIWLFPVWLTAVRIDRRQDLTSLYFQLIYVANVCAVLVYVNESNSFENVLKYQCITDTFVFLEGNVHSMVPSSHFDCVQHKML